MISEIQFKEELNLIIKNAIREDVGSGDYSSLACIPALQKGKAALFVKEDCVLAGVRFAKQVFNYVDSELNWNPLISDGTFVKKGTTAFEIKGTTQSILKAERIVLNAMQRMSAVATKTQQYAKEIAHTKAKILDTRKTTPGIRALEKWAVAIGGGTNHRFGLYDMIMLKDNHIDFSGGVSNAIHKTVDYLAKNQLDLKIIVEARSLDEIEEIIRCKGVYRILIDNFSVEETRKAVTLINGACLTESSGNITLETIKDYADCGVDFISCGAITHSVKNVDLSLKAVS